jgi:hypothetical protein
MLDLAGRERDNAACLSGGALRERGACRRGRLPRDAGYSEIRSSRWRVEPFGRPSLCNFNNTTDRGVPFGESSDTEMC